MNFNCYDFHKVQVCVSKEDSDICYIKATLKKDATNGAFFLLKFSLNDFMLAKQTSKYKHETSKFDYVPFDKAFINLYKERFGEDKEPKPMLLFLLQNTKLFPSELKRFKLGKFYNLPFLDSSVKGWGNCGRRTNGSAVAAIIVIDNAEVQRCISNMNNAVSKAASSHDMNFFWNYKQAYVDLQKAKHLSPVVSKLKEKNLIKEFYNKVDNAQSNKV